MIAADVTPSVVLDRTEIHGDGVAALVLRCVGEIDSLNAADLASSVAEGLTRVATAPTTDPLCRRVLVVDLREVSFFGASAVTALLLGAQDIPDGTALRLVVGGARSVLLVVEALDLHTTFSIHDGLTDALLPGRDERHEEPSSSAADR